MGRKKLIETPKKMYELFEKYKKHVKDNPRQVSEFHGRDGEERRKPLERPLTFAGFDIFVMNLEGIESRGVEQYFTNQDKLYVDYIGICSRIKKEIRDDQITGGVVGQYNASITQRLNGLTDKQEVTQKVEQPLFPEDE